jgi:hypothetical protein
MNAILESLAASQTASAQSGSTPWRRLVIDVADGVATDESAVLAALADCGRTLADLVAAVDLLNRRRKWAAEVAAGSQAEPALPEVDAEMAALESRREAAIAEFDDEARRLLIRKREAAQRVQTAAAAKRELLATASSEAISAATADIDQRIAEVERERNAVERDIHERHQALADSLDAANAGKLRDILKTLTTRRDSFNPRIEKLLAERATAMTIALEPTCI